MEFIINREYFTKAISDVMKAVSSKTTFPILTGIKLIAETDRIILIGSNADITIKRTIPQISDNQKIFEVLKAGSVVVSAKIMSEISKKLPGDIHLSLNHDQTVTLQSEEIKTKLTIFNGEDYPTIPEVTKTKSVTIKSDILLEMIKQTAFASSKNESRPVLTGVNFSFQENVLTCVATNSHRLAMKTYKVNSGLTGSFIVPSSTLLELTKLFGNQPTDIEIYASDTIILFTSQNLSLYSRLIEGVYPNVSGLIPEETTTIVTVNTRELLSGMNRASLFASEWKNNNIHLQIHDGSKIKMSSKSSEMGQIEETQGIKRITGDTELHITIDGNFMMDALKVIQEDEVKLCFNGTMRPILVLPVGNDSQLQLISPVRS
ncbi:DNA polymerase III subunit beta [Bacillus sp. BGMRC 2118]|nr:DNA polymerase III subunit beta [Bacillus sp. BGMRC 2118]